MCKPAGLEISRFAAIPRRRECRAHAGCRMGADEHAAGSSACTSTDGHRGTASGCDAAPGVLPARLRVRPEAASSLHWPPATGPGEDLAGPLDQLGNRDGCCFEQDAGLDASAISLKVAPHLRESGRAGSGTHPGTIDGGDSSPRDASRSAAPIRMSFPRAAT